MRAAGAARARAAENPELEYEYRYGRTRSIGVVSDNSGKSSYFSSTGTDVSILANLAVPPH